MANDIGGNPFVLDTVGSVTTDQISIDFIRWVGGAAAGDQCILKSGGRVIWKSLAPATNYVEQSPIRKKYFGLTLDTLSSGTVYVYLDLLPKVL